MTLTTPAAALLGILLFSTPSAGQEARGPLRVHPDNPRYFTDGTGRVVYLTGTHTWNSLPDMGESDPPPAFDFGAYLDYLEKHRHTFIRLWTWESATWNTRGNREKKLHRVAPLCFARTGPGKARDGKPKFDLSKYEPEYFKRLRARVEAAGRRGLYVSVMLFEGWAMQHAPGAWESHPFHPDNNVNGIDADANGDGRGLEVHELVNPKVKELQEAYVRKMIDTVNDLDNVLYEISNENHPPSTEWQYHMIRFIKAVERGKAKQHPVGMTFQYKGGSNETLFKSPADWISPNPHGGYRDDPPVADGRKVVVTDTDHLWGIGGNVAWVWKSFLRGHNPIFMDPYDGSILGNRFDKRWQPILRAMGHTRRFADRMNLAAATPQPALASTEYCLAAAGREYLVYLPEGGKVGVNLSVVKGKLSVEWFNPENGKSTDAGEVEGGAERSFTAPFKGHAVLYLRRK